MTTDTLEFPAIEEPMAPAPKPTADLQDVAEIRDGKAIVRLSRTDAGLAQLRADLAGKTYALATTKGNEAARADRKRCVDLRASTEKLRKALKAPALEFGRLVDAEAKRITEAVELLEAPIDAAIKADEERREAERQERARIEAERIAGLNGQVDAIMRGYLDRCAEPDMTAERIANGIIKLGSLTMPDSLADVALYWSESMQRTLSAMAGLKLAAERREETARLEAQRAEQERQAAALAAEREELNRRAAELAAQEARARQAREAQEKTEREAAEADRRTQEVVDAAKSMAQAVQNTITEGRASQQVLKAEPATADATDREKPASTSPAGVPMGVGQADAAAPAVEEAAPDPIEPATLSLGAIRERLQFALTEAFVSEVLGIAAADRDKRAVLYRASQWPAIKAALIKHITTLE